MRKFDGPGEVPVVADLKADSLDQSRVFYVAMGTRPGVQRFLTRLEYEHFTPDTPENAKFVLYMSRFAETLWFVVSIPAERQPVADTIATECGLRAVQGAIPRLMDQDGVHSFPITAGDNVFTVENIDGHPVYGNDKAKIAEMVAEEFETCRKIVDDHYNKFMGARPE